LTIVALGIRWDYLTIAAANLCPWVGRQPVQKGYAMKRFVLTLVAALALSLSIAGAASADQSTPGIPRETNCKGQSTAWMAQRDLGDSLPGLGNHARFLGLSVTGLQERISTKLCLEE